MASLGTRHRYCFVFLFCQEYTKILLRKFQETKTYFFIFVFCFDAVCFDSFDFGLRRNESTASEVEASTVSSNLMNEFKESVSSIFSVSNPPALPSISFLLLKC